MKSLTVLSPHFDDGVLSCGGQIWETIQAGHGVRVITLFAGPPPTPLPPFAAVQHQMWGQPPAPNRLRRAEDVAAHLRLGCEDVVHLEVPDAVYRVDRTGEPLYGGEDKIFGDLHLEERARSDDLVALVRPQLLPESLLLAPLGVGGHVDHQLGHAVGQKLAMDGILVAFYEELPYVEWPAERARIARATAAWRSERVRVSEEAIIAKVAAMAYYQTQIPVLYGDIAESERRLRAVASQVAGGEGYAEHRWWRQDG